MNLFLVSYNTKEISVKNKNKNNNNHNRGMSKTKAKFSLKVSYKLYGMERGESVN